MVKVPARLPVNQRPLAIPLVISRDFIKPRLSQPQPHEAEDDGPGHHESSPQEGANAYGNESSQGLFIPIYLEEAIPDDPVLQVKMAHAMRAQEVETRRCFTCNQLGHLQRDHWKYEEKNGNGPLQLKGPPLNKSAQERVKVKPPPSGRSVSQTNPPK